MTDALLTTADVCASYASVVEEARVTALGRRRARARRKGHGDPGGSEDEQGTAGGKHGSWEDRDRPAL